MDKISLAGLAIGLVAIIGGQILEGGHVGSLVQPTALLIVLGGTIGAALLQSRQAIRQAEDLGLPSALLSATDQVLSQQEASLRATARKVVRMAYAY